jgi:hypothetical protein
MPNKSLIERIYQSASWGIKVSRAAAADPQAAFLPIYQISNGFVAITGLFGIRTVAQAGGASTMQFEHSVGPTVLDSGTLSIAGNGIDTIYTLDGDAADPIVSGISGAPILGATANGQFRFLFLAGPGTINVTMTAAAGTGSTGYVLFYIPIDDIAIVSAI